MGRTHTTWCAVQANRICMAGCTGADAYVNTNAHIQHRLRHDAFRKHVYTCAPPDHVKSGCVVMNTQSWGPSAKFKRSTSALLATATHDHHMVYLELTHVHSPDHGCRQTRTNMRRRARDTKTLPTGGVPATRSAPCEPDDSAAAECNQNEETRDQSSLTPPQTTQVSSTVRARQYSHSLTRWKRPVRWLCDKNLRRQTASWSSEPGESQRCNEIPQTHTIRMYSTHRCAWILSPVAALLHVINCLTDP